MPEYLAPGVYIEEISTGPKPIEGVGTSTLGFAGETERGPEYAKFIGSWLEFQRWFGGYMNERSHLPYAIQGYFDNGGKRCFVARVTGAGSAFTRGAIGTLQASAIGRGAWGNNIRVKVTPARKFAGGFRIQILYYRDMPDPFLDPTNAAAVATPGFRPPDVFEDYDNLTHQPLSNNAATVINGASKLIRVWWPPGAAATVGPQEFSPVGSNGADGQVTPTRFEGQAGQIDATVPDDLLGRDTGLAGLERVDEIAVLAIPDEVRHPPGTVTQRVIQQCERLKDRFAIVSIHNELRSVEISNLTPPQDSKYAAFYYPWIWIFDPSINDYVLVPPSGHIAGIYARTDIDYGVHKAPANEVVRGAVELEFAVTKEMQDVLNPKGVNCVRDFRADRRGIRLWGARTMSSDPEWKYVNVRRLFIYVEESIDEATQWVVFEPNNETTWSRVARSISAFLVRVWKSGALMGLTQEEAFFVKCDRTTMTQDDIDNGRLICYIGIAPAKPAEFVIFRISQKTMEAQS